MNRKIVIWLLTSFCLTNIPLAVAQQAKIPKIGRLSPISLASGGQRSGLLGRELRALGYVEGKNIAIEYRYADNKLDRLPALAEELVGLQTLPWRSAVESKGSRLCATMERKPTSSTRTGVATSFHGGQQRRQIRERVPRGNSGA